jgi:hypothetical protein
VHVRHVAVRLRSGGTNLRPAGVRPEPWRPGSRLFSRHKRADALEGELILLSPNRDIRRLFEVTGIDTSFTIQPSNHRTMSPQRQPEVDRTGEGRTFGSAALHVCIRRVRRYPVH